MDRHGSEGPSALVETDGAMRIVDVVRYGPKVTELDDQQQLADDVMGRVAPTLKPFKPAGSVDEEGVAPHADLQASGGGGSGRAARRSGKAKGVGSGRSAGGAKRTGGRGRG
ncbi:MAG: hypothetical protein P8N02_18315 [Actinomycetota bacterium]|nr:hypothetical protein [Actinomycetota bacterium]